MKKLDSSNGLSGWLRTSQDTYELPNGNPKVYDIIHYRDSTVVLAITKDLKVVMAEQFRPGPERKTLEMPGGIVDPGEDPWDAAERELLEETGYAGDIAMVGHFMKGAFATGTKYAFLAINCEKVQEQSTDEDEFIDIKLVDLAWFRGFVDSSDFVDVGQAYRALRIYDGLNEKTTFQEHRPNFSDGSDREG